MGPEGKLWFFTFYKESQHFGRIRLLQIWINLFLGEILIMIPLLPRSE